MITCYFGENKAIGGLRHVTVNALIIDNDKVLLGKRGTAHGWKMTEFGKWGLIGGYLGRDETCIQALKREAIEESGSEIDAITLFRIKDDPNRPKEDTQNVDFIFIAHFVKQIGSSDTEVTELKWFPLSALPAPEQIAFDHGESIELYKEYLKKNHSLPLLG